MSSMILRIIEEMELCCEEIEITNQKRGTYIMNQQVVLDHITNLLKCDLSQSLVGIYSHGSMAMGSFPLNKVILIY